MTIPVSTNLAVTQEIAEPPPPGTIIYLASYLLRLALKAQITPPDTPNMYTGDLQVLGDAGDMGLDPLVGPRGYPGQAQFPLRKQDTPVVNDISELPNYLTDTEEDIGKYWEIAIFDFEGVITAVQSWVWYGTSWRMIQMGTTGPPGAIPEIQLSVEPLPPQEPTPYPDTTSFIETSGTRLEPSWIFHPATPQGPMGPISPVYTWPDTDFTTIAPYDVLAASGEYNDAGEMIFKPLSLASFDTGFYSVPESAFTAYNGASQQAPIASFAVPPQPHPWTPVVWGHIGEGGVMLTKSPFKVGCEVLLGDAASGPMVARGFGTTIGEVNIVPHYSTPDDKNKSMSPINNYAVVPANHTGDEGTIYANLWNDGQWGAYSFDPQSAQLFVLAMPLLREPPTAPTAPSPITVVQTCNNSSPNFPASITAGNAVVILIGGASNGQAVTVHPPQLDPLSPFTPANTFAVWNDGTSGCLQSPPGNIDAGGYFLSIYVLPDCFATNGLQVLVDNALAAGWTALEVSGLGNRPYCDDESHQTGGTSSTTYVSGVAATTIPEALIVASSYSGGGMGSVPGAPWTTFETAARGAGYQVQSYTGSVFSWSGALSTPESWVAGIAAIVAGS